MHTTITKPTITVKRQGGHTSTFIDPNEVEFATVEATAVRMRFKTGKEETINYPDEDSAFQLIAMIAGTHA